ncbi:MAG: hypothetical protein LBV75_08525, partial [Paludibacter sp.]|nr:hypothetical protein [Paludibacter sp.]
MKKLVLLFSLIALIYSCGPKKSEFDALKSQNDSLMLEKHRMQDEVDSYFASMNKIEQNIAQIKEQEGLISTRTSNVESGSSSDIELDLQSIQQIL